MKPALPKFPPHRKPTRGVRAEAMRRLYFCEGWTLGEIGDIAGVSTERVRQILEANYPGLIGQKKVVAKTRRERQHRLVIRNQAIRSQMLKSEGGGRRWTRNKIIAAIRLWNETYGRPPSAMEWNPSGARNMGRPDWSDRFYEDGCWPVWNTVTTRFGSWNAAIEAAGFEPRKVGGRDDFSHRQPLAVAKLPREDTPQ